MAKGKRPGDTPPVQKGTGSITKKKPETKAADAAAAKPRKPKSKSNTAEDDEALIASLISCASGSEKKEKKEGLQQDLDMELVAALAAEACLPARHAGCDSSETGAEPLPASYLDDEEDHLSLEDNELRGSDELGGSVEAPADDDGVMIASLIDGAAEKNMDMELVAALAADAMTPASKGAQRSFADESVEVSVNDSALAADVDEFMNGSSESLSLEAQLARESPAQHQTPRDTSSPETEPSAEREQDKVDIADTPPCPTTGRDWHEDFRRDERTKCDADAKSTGVLQQIQPEGTCMYIIRES